MLHVCGFALYDTAAASTRYRLAQYIGPLRQHGVELEIFPLLGKTYIEKTYSGQKYSVADTAADYLKRLAFLRKQWTYDAAIVQAELFPLLPGAIESRLIRIPYICDFDDATFLKYRLDRFKPVSLLLKNKFDPVIGRAAAVLAGNAYLQDYAGRRNRDSVLLPTVIDTERYQVAPRRNPHRFTIGWIGSPTTSVYLRDLAEPLARLGRNSAVRLIAMGGRCEEIPNVEIINLPWSEAREVDTINTFDVGVMPLFDDDWAKGKCAFKLIQYMGCGVPVIASPVGANIDVATPDCGLLAADADGWLNALRLLCDNPGLRQQMGAAARQRVEAAYSLNSAIPTLAATIKRVVARNRGKKML